MIVNDVEKKAAEMREQHGGTIFAFPINEEDPFSSYAVVMYAGERYHTYPECTDISEAATGVKVILEELEKKGYDADYKSNVRFVSYQAQIDAPSVTMRRLKKLESTRPALQRDVDVTKKDGVEGEYLFSARGVLKFSYLSMLDEKLPKAIQFMDEYYKLLAMRKYGKTVAAIKQEVRKMNKDQGCRWIEETYKKYIRDDMEVMNIMNGLMVSTP